MTDLLQATTSRADVNPPDPASQLALGRMLKSADELEMRDSERDDLGRADVDRSKIVRSIARRQSMPNGEWAIRNIDDLRVAINNYLNPSEDRVLSNVYGAGEIQRHIIARARDLQMTGLLPRDWGVNQEMNPRRQQRLMLEALENKVDSIFLMTCEQLEQSSFGRISDYYLEEIPSGAQLLQASRFFSAKTRRKYASQGIALPDGSFPIPDKDALRRAIRLVGKGGAAAKRHIIKRAKALSATGMLPSKWGIGGAKTATAESDASVAMVAEGTSLYSLLLMDGDKIPYPLILEDKTSEDESGFARIKVPFFVGGSINKPPSINRKVRFPTRILQETVIEGNRQIAEGRQPLSVYPRHAKALSGNDLPIGGIVQLLAEGHIGYAIMDVVNEGEGKQAIALMKHKPPLLNAVSLRSGPNRFELREIELEQETIFEVNSLRLDGVDFAPDAPAMPTWGVQVLSAETEPGVDSEKNSSKEEYLNLTAETLRSEHPALVEELTAPLTDEITSLRQEIKERDRVIAEFREQKRRDELAAYVVELANTLPESQQAEGLKLFQEIATEEKTREAFSARVLPTFTKLLSSGEVVEKKETDMERLAKLWPQRGGNGVIHGITQEKKTVGGTDDEDKEVETAQGLEVPA